MRRTAFTYLHCALTAVFCGCQSYSPVVSRYVASTEIEMPAPLTRADLTDSQVQMLYGSRRNEDSLCYAFVDRREATHMYVARYCQGIGLFDMCVWEKNLTQGLQDTSFVPKSECAQGFEPIRSANGTAKSWGGYWNTSGGTLVESDGTTECTKSSEGETRELPITAVECSPTGHFSRWIIRMIRCNQNQGLSEQNRLETKSFAFQEFIRFYEAGGCEL